jgi:hypothetical protein
VNCIILYTCLGSLDIMTINRSNHVCGSASQGAKARTGGVLYQFIYLPRFLGHYDKNRSNHVSGSTSQGAKVRTVGVLYQFINLPCCLGSKDIMTIN